MDNHTQELLEQAYVLTFMVQAAAQEGRHAFTIDRDFVQQLSDKIFNTLNTEAI